MRRFIEHHELARDSRFVRQDNAQSTVLSTLPDDVDAVVNIFDQFTPMIEASVRGTAAEPLFEEYGPGFTTGDVADAWQRYLPMAYTAEDVALKNLAKRVTPDKAGRKNNPFCEWIGADIRSDPWGYMAPGWPQMAADMAFRGSTLPVFHNHLFTFNTLVIVFASFFFYSN